MKKVFRYFTMMLAIGGATLTSCLDKEEIVNNQKEQYQDNWVKVFGDIDPDHDWSVAKQVNATFNLAGVVSGEHTARIYTEQPGHKRCKLLAELTLNGTGNVSFNIEKVSEEVFIKVTDANGKTAFDGYFTIEGNQLTADSRTIASRGLARDASSGTSLGSAQTKSLGTVYRSGTNEYNEFYNTGSDTGEQAVSLGDIKYFTEVQTPERVRYNFADSILPIIQQGGVFAESQDNRHLMSQGVEYVTSQEGEVALSLVYGATALYNSFGYYYWKGDNATSAPKIILINDARPHSLLKPTDDQNATWSNVQLPNDYHSMTIGNQIQNNQRYNYIWGSKYKLVYYGDNYDQQGTYTFPEDVHIGFFILTSYWNKSENGMAFGKPADEASPLTGNSNYLQTLMYSIPDHNKNILEYFNYRTSIEKDQNGSNNVVTGRGEVSAVTYQYQGRKYLGFEDGVDKDMNDLIFLVEANIEVEGADNAFVDRDEDYIPEVETNSWIIACEDLGSVGDYDFNDAVFSVSHVGGSNTLTVTPLAAGGTYPIEVLYNDLNIGGSEGTDFHKLIDSEASVSNELYSPINAYTRGTAGEPITIEGVPADYDINNHGFTVKVTKNPNEGAITITAPDHKEVKAPQMLVLPGNWIWPVENKNIHIGYPQFENWTNNQDENKEWYKNPVQEDGWLVDKPSTDEDEPGQGGSDSGSGSGSATPIVKTLPVYNGDSKIGDINVEGGEWNYYIEIPAGHITNNGATITFTGANESGNNIEIKLDGQQKAHTSTNVMTISDASQLSGKAVDLYFWMNADSFNKISSIVINNTGNGGSGTEEPDNIEVSGFKGELINGYTVYTIPVLEEYKASDVTGIKVTVTITSAKTTNVAFYSDKNNYTNHDVHSSQQIQAGQSYEFTISKDKYQNLSNIYTGTQDKDAGIASISVEVVKTTTPTTVTLQITGGATSTLTLEGNEGNYYVTIPAGTFGNNGATIEFTSSDQNSQIQNVTVGGQNGYTTVENRNGYLKIEVPSSMVNSSNATTIRLPKTVTSIVITNKENTSSGDGITFTVDGVAKSNLTINGQYFAIPTSVFTGNNGATIYIEASSTDYSAELKNVNNSNIIPGQIKGEATLSADQVSSFKNESEIRLYLYHNAAVITGIRIVNNNSDVTEPEPEVITIPITVNDTGKNALTATNNKFTIPLSEYGISSNGATITFAGGATITINGTDYTTTYDVESSNYNKDIEVTIKSGTITQITITDKESGTTGDGTDKITISNGSGFIPASLIEKQKGNNGIIVNATFTTTGDNLVIYILEQYDLQNAATYKQPTDTSHSMQIPYSSITEFCKNKNIEFEGLHVAFQSGKGTITNITIEGY